MSTAYELPDLCDQWWDLVWYLADEDTRSTGSGWRSLDHVCGGVAVNRLFGAVQSVGKAARSKLVSDIADEVWSSDRLGLDYEVTEKARAEYADFLRQHGLEPGDMKRLTQGVYPTANTEDARRVLGIGSPPCQEAALLVLGQNCD